VYSVDASASQPTKNSCAQEAVPPTQPSLLHQRSAPALQDANTRLLEAVRSLDEQKLLASANDQNMLGAPASSSSSSTAMDPRIEETMYVNAEAARSKPESRLMRSGELVPAQMSDEEVAHRRASAVNAATSIIVIAREPAPPSEPFPASPGRVRIDSDMFACGPRRSRLESELSEPSRQRKGSLAIRQLRAQLIERAGSVREAFKLLDTNANGMVCLTEFLAGLQTLQIDLDQLTAGNGASALFHELTAVHDRDDEDGDSGAINILQLLGISQEEAHNPEHMATMELWHKVESGKEKAKKRKEARCAMWSDGDVASGEAGQVQLLRMQAQTRKKNATSIIARDWKATRPTQSLRDSQLLLNDPRLHRKCAREAVHTPVEAVVLREQDDTRKCIHHIKQAMRSCAESRHQVVHMQHLLKPAVEEEVVSSLATLSSSFQVSMRRASEMIPENLPPPQAASMAVEPSLPAPAAPTPSSVVADTAASPPAPPRHGPRATAIAAGSVHARIAAVAATAAF